MKHAYLILAHGQWELLHTLLRCIDDPRNDIFVHIDAKVHCLPELHTEKAGLFVLDRRVDVRWGDVSVVKAEYELFRQAVEHGPYAYYHLLSGTDLPLKSQDYIHRFLSANQGREFIGYTLTAVTSETERKAQRWHLFPRQFRSKNVLIRALRAGFLRIQELLGIKRNRCVEFKKGSQWVSVTHEMALCFLEHRDWVLKTFTHTFCADEMVFQTLCCMSPLQDSLWSRSDDARGCMRAIGWRDGCLVDWGPSDYEKLAKSDALFARKFNCSDMEFINRIAELSR